MLATETIDYTIRESPRARRVSFRVTPGDGLIVMIPRGFDRHRIPVLVAENHAWIARALKRVAKHQSEQDGANRPPDEIRLEALDRTWRVRRNESAAVDVSVEAVGPFDLRVMGASDDPDAWRRALGSWLIERAREHLVPWTEEMAETLGVRLRRISVRSQRTRWGSYSTRGTVSLNAQLLFLPYRLARYVILHELCHAVHPNHSPAFWGLMRTHEPESERLRTELRGAWRHVPPWAVAWP